MGIVNWLKSSVIVPRQSPTAMGDVSQVNLRVIHIVHPRIHHIVQPNDVTFRFATAHKARGRYCDA